MSNSKKVLNVNAGSVAPCNGCGGVLDTLTFMAKNIGLVREALANVPGIGKWLLASFDGENTVLLQFFPNNAQMPDRESVKVAAEIFMSHVGGKWRPHGELGESRLGQVRFPDVTHPSIVILHNVEGLAEDVK